MDRGRPKLWKPKAIRQLLGDPFVGPAKRDFDKDQAKRAGGNWGSGVDRLERRNARRRLWRLYWNQRKDRKGHCGKPERRFFRLRPELLRMIEAAWAKRKRK